LKAERGVNHILETKYLEAINEAAANEQRAVRA